LATGQILVVLALLGLMVPSPAGADVSVGNQMRANIDLVNGPRLYGYGTGTTAEFANEAQWASGAFRETVYDEDEAGVSLLRKGDEAPSPDVDWWDKDWNTRRCYHIDNILGVEEQDAVAVLTIDTTQEVPDRMRPDGGDIRAVLSVDGSEVPLWFDPQTIPDIATVVEVEVPNHPIEGTDVCLYWGNAEAASVSQPNRIANGDEVGGLIHRQWQNLAQNKLNSADFTRPPDVEQPRTSSQGEANVCENCAFELVGYVIPPLDGDYTFWFTSDDQGELLLSTDDDPANLQPIASVPFWAAATDWTKYATQSSAPVALVAGQRYALRARVREGYGGDHIRVGWDPPGPATPTVIGNAHLADVNGVEGQITYRKWLNLAEDKLRSVNWELPPLNETVVPTATIPPNVCNRCASELSGWLMPTVSGEYELFIASDDEGALWLSPDEDPANLVQIGHVPGWAPPNNWGKFPEQSSGLIQLVAGERYAIRARMRELTGGDNLQIGWRRPGEATIQVLPADVLAPTLGVHTSVGQGVEGLYCSSGTWESPPIDTAAPGTSIYGLLGWEADLPDGTTITAQVATADSADGPWEYLGPDGTVDTFYGLADSPVGHVHDGAQFIRVKLTLATESGLNTPILVSAGVEHTLTEIFNELAVAAPEPGDGDRWLMRIKPAPFTDLGYLTHRGPSDLTRLNNTALRLDDTTHVAVVGGVLTQEVGPLATIDATRTFSVALVTDAGPTPAALRATWTEQPANRSVLIEHDLTITIG